MSDAAELVRRWNDGGEQLLFDALLPHVAVAAEPSSTAVLYDYTSSIFAHTIPSFHEPPLPRAHAAALLERLLQSLPSSSSGSQDGEENAPALRDTLIDVIWSLDTLFDDKLVELAAQIKTRESAVAEDPSKASEVQSLKDQRAAVERERKDFAQLLNELLSRGVLQLAQCRSRLDFGLLAAAGLITNKVLLEKKEIQTRTRLFYKQNKFNLLREQSEGYSKLAVELLASIPAPHGIDARPLETDEGVQSHARIAWDNIVTLIGYFDLDPNRALDVILDAFSTNVVHHHAFFVALLRLSPWCNRPVARDAERMNVEAASPAGASMYTRKSFDNVLRIAQGIPELEDDEMELDEAVKVSVCSQVLGFKFAYYASSPRVDAPRSLFLVAAILTREGLIALEDILPHLTPIGDDDMTDARTKFEKECAEKISNARASALAMAAPLTDDTTTKSGKTADQERQATRTEVNQQDQRTQYIHALLAVGALVPAFDLLSLTPWVVSATPEIADLLLRTAHHSLQPLYQQYHSRNSRLSSAVSGTKKKFSPSAGLASATPLKQILTAWAPPPPSTATTEYVFFFPAWVDWVPLCTVHSDVEHILEPILRFIGPLLHRETEFMAKLCRVGKIQLAGRNSSAMEFWATLARLYLLPGMSLLHNNLTIAVEVWSVLGTMDTVHRWALYGDWATRSYQLYPELRIRKVEADREARAIMRRLGSKNVQTLARAVGKLAHSNPCILFANMVNQVMAYDNLAEVVTDSLKFCTMLPFDVLMYTVLSAFADPDKERVKEDGISVSAWLQSLASFTGLLCRRHYQLDHSLVMQYVVNRLRMDQVNDIIVLRELIAKTTGISPVDDLSSDAIVALTGGPTLRIEATASTSRGAGVDKVLLQTKATERLVAAFNQHGLGRTILILTGRQAHGCVHMQPQVHYLKSLSTLYDSVQQVQAQLIDCLSTTLSPQAYSRLLPSVEELCGQYGVNIYSVMQMYRPKLLHDILVHIDAFRSVDAKPAESTEEAERRLKAALAAKRGEAAAAPASATTDQKTSPIALDATIASTADMPSPSSAAEPSSPWLPPLEPIIHDVASVLPPNVAAVLGAPFFVTFWQLSLLDLRPPMDHYKAQTDRLSKELKAKNDELKTTTRGSRDIKAKRDRIQAAVDSLVKETAAVMHNMEFTRGRLTKEKAHWFVQAMNNRDLAPQIVQHCITPRALLSPMDADFCSFFIKTLHLTATPGFHTLGILDGIFKSFGAAIVFSCSGNEARNYGRFLKNVLGDLMTWNKTQDCFKDKNKGILPGFSIMRGAGRPLTQSDIMDPPGLKRFTRKCHARLTAGLTSSIKDGEYMGVYNSIVILNELSDVLPLAEISAASGDIIYSTIKECVEKETREDLKILAQAYLAKLGQRRKLWESQTTSDDASKGSTDKPRPPLTVPDTASPVPSRPQSTVPPSGSSSTNARTTQSELDRAPSSDPKAILSNIPRPDVVKRVSREPPRQEQALAASRPTPSSTNGTHSPAPRDSGLRAPSGLPMKPDLSHRGGLNGSSAHSSRPPSPSRSGPSTSTSRREPPLSPRSHRPSDDHAPRPNNPSMPPPGAPSSTATAQDLRRTSARDERDRDARAPPRGPHSGNPPRGSSPPARRPSPRGSRDTRNAPVPGRHDDRSLGSENPRVSHDAPGRPAVPPRDDNRDSRDRPPPGRGREGDRGSDDRQHERDRHHQPESRDREGDRRPAAAARPEDEQSRRVVNTASVEEQAGSKRRRHSEDESADRSSKRVGGSSRHKDSSSHRDDRTRHRSEKERDREAGDKRGHRKERERRDDGGRDRESRGNDDRPPRSDATPQNSKPAPPPPSQPRAMASGGDSQRPSRQDSSSRRADSPRSGPEASRGSGPSGNLSLRDRIGGAAGGDSGGSRDGSLKRPHDAAADGRDSDGDSGRKRQRIVRGRYRDAISASQLGGSGPPPPE